MEKLSFKSLLIWNALISLSFLAENAKGIFSYAALSTENGWEAGDCFDAQNFDLNYGEVTGLKFLNETNIVQQFQKYQAAETEDSQEKVDFLDYAASVRLFGLTTTESEYPVLCYHYHLYSFTYQDVEPVELTDIPYDLVVTAFTMVGLSQESCSLVVASSVSFTAFSN